MRMRQSPLEMCWQQAVDTGDLGLWDLRPELETVQCSPPWKQRLGFPEPQAADSTHFWRCRVHPEDLQAMLTALQRHARGEVPTYEARFRLRSNGSGYRLVHSRGRVVERGDDGRALRIVGTMVDLTGRPSTPQAGLPGGSRGAMAGAVLACPFHQLLCAQGSGAAGTLSDELLAERRRLLGLVADLLQASVDELDGASARA